DCEEEEIPFMIISLAPIPKKRSPVRGLRQSSG
ncbi:hypothetical protein A2U01_0097901, partial [Trifolium medium]|nr:hypothetical protein [Trifolium medium]